MGTKRSKAAGVSGKLRQQLAHIRASEKSGESLKDYAGHHGLSIQSLYQGKKVARQQGLLPPRRSGPSRARAGKKEFAPARFAEAILLPPRSGSKPAWRIRLASGDVLESDSALQPEEQPPQLSRDRHYDLSGRGRPHRRSAADGRARRPPHDVAL